MELLLVRHGQPEWVDGDGVAHNDPGLTALGRAQAFATAGALATMEVDELLCSTARRSRETVVPIADVLGLDVTYDDDIHEIRMSPDWDGQPADEISEWFRTSRRRNRHEWWQGAPGGEDFGGFHERVTAGIDRLLGERGVTRHDDPGGERDLWDVAADDRRRIVVVAHAGTNSVVTSHLLGIEPQPWEWERFASDHASITVLRTTPIAGQAIWSLQRFSDHGHLPEVTA